MLYGFQKAFSENEIEGIKNIDKCEKNNSEAILLLLYCSIITQQWKTK
jgi:hypothetical protein